MVRLCFSGPFEIQSGHVTCFIHQIRTGIICVTYERKISEPVTNLSCPLSPASATMEAQRNAASFWLEDITQQNIFTDPW